MTGLERQFRCKKCITEQTHNIRIAKLYKINNLEAEFVSIRCKTCGAQHFVDSKAYIVDEVTETIKNKKFEEVAHFMGRSDTSRERFFKYAKFLAVKDAVFAKEEVKQCVPLRVCYY